jgi:hypothetical protein
MRKLLLSLAFLASTLSVGFSSPALAAGYEGARDSHKRPHGWGVYVYPGGGRYEGQWQFGEKAGRGIREWRDGSRYDGQWQHNMPHGKGVMTYPGGGSYRGDFRAGKRSGRGVETLKDGSEYTGQFRADYRHGTGTLVRPDGSRYEGGWIKGLQQGEGLIVNADGSAFRGNFMAGKAQGKGECLARGVTSACRYENGKPAVTAVAAAPVVPPSPAVAATPSVVAATPSVVAATPSVVAEPLAVASAASSSVRALRARGSLVPPPQGTAAVKAARAAASAVARMDTPAVARLEAPAVAQVETPVAAVEAASVRSDAAAPKPVASAPRKPLSLTQQLSLQGSGMFFEHDLPKLSLAGAASHGWWRKSVALFGGGLEMIVVKGGERLLVRIPSYKGPGRYPADAFQVSLVTPGGRFVSGESPRGALTIDSDESGWISGSFESVTLESSTDGKTANLARGLFRLADEMPQVASALNDL